MLTIEVNDAAVIEVLNRVAAKFDNTLPLYKSIGEILLGSTIDRFAKCESSEGQKWKPKSPVTLAQYAKTEGKASLTRPLFGLSGILSSQFKVEPEADQVTIGSAQVYARMMQQGGTKAAYPHLWGDIPARPFIGLSQQDIVNIVAETEEFIARAFGEQR